MRSLEKVKMQKKNKRIPLLKSKKLKRSLMKKKI
jgi:hypothetical protein